jgi:hypothetical protein
MHFVCGIIIDWIYTQAKVSGQGSLELAQENRKKERKNYSYKWLFFKHSGSA